MWRTFFRMLLSKSSLLHSKWSDKSSVHLCTWSSNSCRVPLTQPRVFPVTWNGTQTLPASSGTHTAFPPLPWASLSTMRCTLFKVLRALNLLLTCDVLQGALKTSPSFWFSPSVWAGSKQITEYSDHKKHPEIPLQWTQREKWCSHASYYIILYYRLLMYIKWNNILNF